MTDLAESIETELNQALADDTLELPSLPEVALRIRDTAQHPDVTAQALANVVAQDPGLAARMIQVANSPLYRASRPIDALPLAISRMGVEFAANLATGIAMQQMFQATTDVVDKTLRRYWQQATEVAAISAVLARHFTRLRPDIASLAGLTHVVGVLPILSWAEEHPAVLGDSLTLNRVIDRCQGPLGSAILTRWGFPEEVARVPNRYRDFKRRSTGADYVDVVTVAYLESLVGTGHPDTQLDWHAIPAFNSLGIDPDGATAAVGGEIGEARAAFAA
ncbi:MAG: HDOD domain-containing protein [Pseudomonadales bacterium]